MQLDGSSFPCYSLPKSLLPSSAGHSLADSNAKDIYMYFPQLHGTRSAPYGSTDGEKARSARAKASLSTDAAAFLCEF